MDVLDTFIVFCATTATACGICTCTEFLFLRYRQDLKNTLCHYCDVKQLMTYSEDHEDDRSRVYNSAVVLDLALNSL